MITILLAIVSVAVGFLIGMKIGYDIGYDKGKIKGSKQAHYAGRAEALNSVKNFCDEELNKKTKNFYPVSLSQNDEMGALK